MNFSQLSEKQLQAIYELGNRRHYADESVEEIVDRIVEQARENVPAETTMADLRRLASSASSFHDFSEAVVQIRSQI